MHRGDGTHRGHVIVCTGVMVRIGGSWRGDGTHRGQGEVIVRTHRGQGGVIVCTGVNVRTGIMEG